jgi:hypothetical protein
MSLFFTELMELKGLDTSKKIKLVRHKDKTFDLYKLYLNDQLDLYQSSQSSPVFSECDQIISFIGLEGGRSKFIGVYDVIACEKNLCHSWPDHYLYKESEVFEYGQHGEYLYELKKDERFDFLSGRVVIDWGGSALAWHQWMDKQEKEIIEVLPAGYVSEFPGYLDFVLSFKELVKIIENPDANSKWHQMLSAVAGVYLIVDSKTGKQYVGSAYGKDGILGRWKSYAASGHGGNVQLLNLLDQHTSYASHFTFSLLRTLPKSLTPKEVIDIENLYKTKLGSRKFGYNSN